MDEKGKINKYLCSYFQLYYNGILNNNQNNLLLQENPERFSVFKEPITTSSSAEAFHSQLRMKISKKGNFYKFIDVLTDVDAAKSADFAKAMNGCTSLFKNKNKWYKKRMNFIHERLNQLSRKKITLRDILNQLSYKENCIFEENFINEINESDDGDDDGDDESNDEENVDNSQNTDHLCILCCDRERQVLCLPCKHCKICGQCFQKMEESSKIKGIKILCPICRSIVNDKMFIFV